MDIALKSADLVALFERVLHQCRVRAGETVLIFTDPHFPHPHYPPAAFAAARILGADVYIMTSQSNQGFDDPVVRAAWAQADMVLGMSTVPRGIGSWMYTDTHSAALAAGARVLMVQEPLEVLLRMMPTEETRRRGLAGAQRLQEAREIHIVSRQGRTTSSARTGARPYQCGLADEPGRWDHWPSGMVACAPGGQRRRGVRDRTRDVLLGMWRHAQSRVVLTLEKGRVVSITGGPDAALRPTWHGSVTTALSACPTPAGVPIPERTGDTGMDSESLYGTVLVALGRNTSMLRTLLRVRRAEPVRFPLRHMLSEHRPTSTVNRSSRVSDCAPGPGAVVRDERQMGRTIDDAQGTRPDGGLAPKARQGPCKDLSWGLTPAVQRIFQEKTGRDDPEDYFGIDIRLLA